MAEWNSVVVVAKSLALVCTKDQNRFCFSIWNKKKKTPFFQNPQMKKNPPSKKNTPKTKTKKLKTKTEHLSGH